MRKLKSHIAVLLREQKHYSFLVAAIALAAAMLVLARQTTYGAVIQYDSVVYISVARNLLAGDGFATFLGYPFTSWPPLYPILLAATSLNLFSPHDVSGVLNAIFFGLTVFVAGVWLLRRLESRVLATFAVIAIAIAVPLTWIAYRALSEMSFILFITLTLIYAHKFMDDSKRSSLIWAAIFTAAACSTRYIGVTLVIGIVPMLMLNHRYSVLDRVKSSAVYIVVSLIPLCIWLLRNLLIDRPPAGRRNPLPYHWQEVLASISNTIHNWVFPQWQPEIHTDITFHLVPATVAAIIFLTLMSGIAYLSYARFRKPDAWTTWMPFYVFGPFVLIYIVVFALAASNTYVSIFQMDRLLPPVYIPLFFAAMLVLDRLIIYERHKKLLGTVHDLTVIRGLVSDKARSISLMFIAVLAVFAVWIAYSGVLNMREIILLNTDGAPGSYNNKVWAESELIERFHMETDATTSARIKVYSNIMDPIYIYTDGSIEYGEMPSSRDELAEFVGDAVNDDYVIWFHQEYLGYDYGAGDLQVVSGLEPIWETREGFIFRVNHAYNDPITLHRQAYSSIVTTDPVVQSDFDIYLQGDELSYINDSCTADDIEAKFFLHIFPSDASVLPRDRLQSGFENFDFRFSEHGIVFDNKCLIRIRLPSYDIARIRTGQFTSQQELWQYQFTP